MPNYELTPFHRFLISKLEDLLEGKKFTRLCIVCPPQFGKSTLANYLFPAYVLGRDSKAKVISVSYGSELSEGFGRKVRALVGDDPTYKQIFPHFKLSPDSTAAWHFESTAGAEFTACGVSGPLTGRGSTLTICDDLLKNYEEATSETTIRSRIEWLQSTLIPRSAPGGRFLAIGTRWSERDIQAFIMSQPGFEIVHLPAFAEENDALGRAPGESLWPSKYSAEFLMERRADIGARHFVTEYQGRPSAAQGTIFRRDWFRHYQTAPEKFTRIVQAWDTAFKAGVTNDYSVCSTWGETSTGFYLLHLWRQKVEFPQLKQAAAELAERWAPSDILIEDLASGQSLIQELRSATTYPVIAVKVDRDKESRAHAVTGFFESGRVHFPAEAPWLADLEDELASFPGGAWDDQVDSVSLALNRLRGTSGIFAVLEWGRKLLYPTVIPFPVQASVPPAEACANHHPQNTPVGVVCMNCREPFVAKPDLFSECKCGDDELHIIIAGGQLRCQNTGRQWYPFGKTPRATFMNRRTIN